MEDKIQQVKINFNKIKDIRNNVTLCFNALETKQTKLKATTSEFVKNNRNNIFVFGLDSFQFQSKLIDYEYNDMKKFYLALNNRMYCEYYKLYKIILQYVEDIIGTNKNIEMLKSNNIFPIYKDLEPLKQYNFDTIEELHKTIISLLNTLNDHILFKENQLQLFQQKQKSGLNINNFVNTFDFDIVVIKQKCLLFLSYLDFFHVIHTKHFKRFSKKMKLMNDYLDEDIKFDEELQNKEDDSLKSSASTASLDSNEDATINKPSIKTLFKTNVKKFINTLNVIKPNNNIENHLSLVKNQNINDILETLSHSFDEDIHPILNPNYDSISADKNDFPIESLNLPKNGININPINAVKNQDIPDATSLATNAIKTNITSEIMKSIDGFIFEETIGPESVTDIHLILETTNEKNVTINDANIEHHNDLFDTMDVATTSVNSGTTCENNETIYGHENDPNNDTNDTIKCANNSPSLEELDDSEEVENVKEDLNNKNTNKKKKKKKK